MAQLVRTLVEAPMRLQEYIDSCTCGRSDKAAVNAIKMQLEAKDAAIERLEEEIRRKDTEKDNLVHMQKDLQAQIEEIKRVLDAHATDAFTDISDREASTDAAVVRVQSRYRGNHSRQQVSQKRMEVEQLTLADRQKRSAQMLQVSACCKAKLISRTLTPPSCPPFAGTRARKVYAEARAEATRER